MTVTEFPQRAQEPEDDPGRLPPHDIGAEQCVVGGMLLPGVTGRPAEDVIADVEAAMAPEDYFRPAHQLIHEAITDLSSRGDPVHPVAVAAALTRRGDLAAAGGLDYLHTLVSSAPSSASAGYYARIVRDLARLRRIILAAGRADQAARSGQGTADEISDYVLTEMAEATAASATEPGRTTEQIFWDVLTAAENQQPRGMTTGLLDLDEVFSLDDGEFDLIAASTTVGKSVLGLNIAAHVAIRLGRPVYYWSGEMTADLCMARIIAAEARVPLFRLLNGTLGESDLARAVECAPQITAAPLTLDDTPTVPLAHIRSRLRQMKRTATPAALAMVDHLGLMAVPRAESHQLGVGALSAGFQALARELSIPVVVLHQLNRNPAARSDHRPVLSDLRDSGRLEQDATRVLLLHREDLYERESPRAGEIDVIVAKNRNGPLTIVTAAFQGHYARIDDMAPPEWTPISALEGR